MTRGYMAGLEATERLSPPVKVSHHLTTVKVFSFNLHPTSQSVLFSTVHSLKSNHLRLSMKPHKHNPISTIFVYQWRSQAMGMLRQVPEHWI